MSNYIYPGQNTTLEELTLENALAELRWPDSNEVADQIATTFSGALSVSFAPTNPWFLNHVLGDPPTAGGEGSPPYSYTWTPVGGGENVQSSRWFIGFDLASSTTERVLEGVVFPQMTVEAGVGEMPRVSLTGFYGDESSATSLTDYTGSIVGDEDPLVFHQGDLQIPQATSLARMDQCTFTVQTGARAQRDWQRHPLDAVAGSVETRLSPSKVPTDQNTLDLAYGGSAAPATTVSGAADARLKFGSPGDHSLQIDVQDVTPNTYGWQNVLDQGTDTLEDTELYCGALSITGESSQSSAV
ncbi:phage tail tube protein [Haloarchaeobius sp. HRN-SO-5]|uniref:phage tail tube protein n=1 Tax=Haloarchaeobius sp. HRN-SO-5 TaxID=3446118 RepID=UPI003EBAD4CB